MAKLRCINRDYFLVSASGYLYHIDDIDKASLAGWQEVGYLLICAIDNELITFRIETIQVVSLQIAFEFFRQSPIFL